MLIRIPPYRIFLWGMISFLVGVLVSYAFQFEVFWLFCAAIVGGVFLAWFWRYQIARAGIIVLLFCILGLLRGSIGLHQSVQQPQSFSFTSAKGIIAKEPIQKPDQQLLYIGSLSGNGVTISKESLMLVYASPFVSYDYGDMVTVQCKFDSLEKLTESYRNYLQRQQVTLLCKKPSITVEGKEGNRILRALYSLKHYTLALIKPYIGEPEASLLGGLLVGERSSIPKELSQAFSSVGLTHIVAISGSNVSIVVVMCYTLLALFSLGRRTKFLCTIVFVMLFTLLAGASSATVRAAVMGMTALIATQVGRMPHTTNALVFAAFAMVVLQPDILLFDAGFHLSFLATMGIVYLAPLLSLATARIKAPPVVIEIMTQTAAAIAWTSPYILLVFGNVSLIAPLANLLVLWTIPLIMAYGFGFIVFAGLGHMAVGIVPTIANGTQSLLTVVSWPLWIFLHYIITITRFLSHLPYASITVSSMPLRIGILVCSYGLLSVLLFTKRRIEQLFSKTQRA